MVYDLLGIEKDQYTYARARARIVSMQQTTCKDLRALTGEFDSPDALCSIRNRSHRMTASAGSGKSQESRQRLTMQHTTAMQHATCSRQRMAMQLGAGDAREKEGDHDGPAERERSAVA